MKSPIVILLAIAIFYIATTSASVLFNRQSEILATTPMFSTVSTRVERQAGVTLTFSPSIISDPDAKYYIQWSGITSPATGDIIQIYLVENTSQKVPYPDGVTKKPMFYLKPARHDPKKTGSGRVEVPVYLTRTAGLYAEYLSTKPSAHDLVSKQVQTVYAYSEILVDSHAYSASHVRISRTHNPKEMVIQYITFHEAAVPHYIQLATKPFNQNPQFSTFYANDTNRHYHYKDMFEAPAASAEHFNDPGRFRLSTLQNLTPSTRYYYRVVDGTNAKVLSKEFSFVAPQTPGSYTDLFIFGDLGVGFDMDYWYTNVQTQYHAELTKKAIIQQMEAQQKKNPNYNQDLLLIGDISYARGYQYLWEYFHQSMQPISSSIPFHVSIGNHEYDYLAQKWKPDWSNYAQDSGGEGGVPTFRYYENPTDWKYSPYTSTSVYTDDNVEDYKKRGERSIAYSYNIGTVHIIVFSVEHDFTQDSSQYRFIERDLKGVDRKVTPWVIVTAHRPMYTSTSGAAMDPSQTIDKPGMDLRLRQSLQPMLVKYNVQLFIAGHNHHHSYSCQMATDYVCADKDIMHVDENGAYVSPSVAPLHILTGAAGNDYEPSYNEIQPWYEGGMKLHHHQPEWLVFRTFTFGYSHIIANQTHLTHSYYGNKRRTLHSRVILTDPIWKN